MSKLSNDDPIPQCRRLFLTSKIMEALKSCPESLSDQKLEKLWNTAKAIEEGIHETAEDNRQQYYHMVKTVVPSLKLEDDNPPSSSTSSKSSVWEYGKPIKRLSAGVQKILLQSKEDVKLTEGSSPPKRVCSASKRVVEDAGDKSEDNSSNASYSTPPSPGGSSPEFDVISNRASQTPVPTDSEAGSFDLVDDDNSCCGSTTNPKNIANIWEEIRGTTPQISAPSSVASLGFSNLKIDRKFFAPWTAAPTPSCPSKKAPLIGPMLPVTKTDLAGNTNIVDNLCTSFQKHTTEELYMKLKPVWLNMVEFRRSRPFRSSNADKEKASMKLILDKIGMYADPWDFCEDVWKFFDTIKAYHVKFGEESTAYLWCNEMIELFTAEMKPVMQELGYCCAEKRTKTLECRAEKGCLISWDQVYCSLVFENNTEDISESYTYCKKHFEKLTPQEINDLEQEHQEQLRDEAIPKGIDFNQLPAEEQYAKSRFQLLRHTKENGYEPLKSCKVCCRRWHVACASNASKQVFICNKCWNITKQVFNGWSYVTRLLLTGDFTRRHKTDPPLNCISLLSSLVKDSLSLQLFEEIVEEMQFYPANLHALFESGRRAPYSALPSANTIIKASTSKHNDSSANIKDVFNPISKFNTF